MPQQHRALIIAEMQTLMRVNARLKGKLCLLKHEFLLASKLSILIRTQANHSKGGKWRGITSRIIAVRLTERQPAGTKLQLLTIVFAAINTSGIPRAIQASTIASHLTNIAQLLSHRISVDAAVSN